MYESFDIFFFQIICIQYLNLYDIQILYGIHLNFLFFLFFHEMCHGHRIATKNKCSDFTAVSTIRYVYSPVYVYTHIHIHMLLCIIEHNSLKLNFVNCTDLPLKLKKNCFLLQKFPTECDSLQILACRLHQAKRELFLEYFNQVFFQISNTARVRQIYREHDEFIIIIINPMKVQSKMLYTIMYKSRVKILLLNDIYLFLFLLSQSK